MEKFLAGEIDCLTGDVIPCRASNEFLAGMMEVSVDTINRSLRKLQKLRIVIRLGFHRSFVERCVSPEYSQNPKTSMSWMEKHGIPSSLGKFTKAQARVGKLAARVGKLAAQGRQINQTEILGDTSTRTKTTMSSSRSESSNGSIPVQPESSSSLLACAGNGEVTEEKIVPAAGNVTRDPDRRPSRAKECQPVGAESTLSRPEVVPPRQPNGNGAPRLVPAGVDALLEEFGGFNAKQRRKITDEFEADPDNVMCKAAIVRSEPRKNRARAFLAALRDDWQPGNGTKLGAKKRKGFCEGL